MKKLLFLTALFFSCNVYTAGIKDVSPTTRLTHKTFNFSEEDKRILWNNLEAQEPKEIAQELLGHFRTCPKSKYDKSLCMYGWTQRVLHKLTTDSYKFPTEEQCSAALYTVLKKCPNLSSHIKTIYEAKTHQEPLKERALCEIFELFFADTDSMKRLIECKHSDKSIKDLWESAT